MAEEDLPKPLAWKWSSKTVYAKEGKEGDWVSLTSVLQQQEEEEVRRTWNWSRRFVSKLNLCPWAKGSLETQTAMQVFVAPPNQKIEMLCKQVGAKCLEFCQEFPALESAAIFFLVFSPQENHNDDHDLMDFMDFYDWFTDLEDNWEMEDIIIAPFHPQWQFGGGTDEELLQLDFEKKSPYPTVTFVSATAVERAGTAVTEQISKHNEQVLLEKSLEELKEMWEESLSASAVKEDF
eukprot:scaffold2557_cov121-Cylindrotheca_fusiformis.AAC.28